MDYRSCEAINKAFVLTEYGDVACPISQQIVENSMQRAYIFTNLFFYDVTEEEVNKICEKIKVKREAITNNSDMPPDAVERLFPALSSQFKLEVGDNSLDPLIKEELGKIKTNLSIQLSKDEKKQLYQMREAICSIEIDKFKKATIFQKDNKGKPYIINFSKKYINGMPERAKKIMKPTIKMLAYMQGLQFETFDLSPEFTLTYTWADAKPVFDENKIKEEVKSVIAQKAEDIV